MHQTGKFVLCGLAVVLAAVLIGRMLRTSTPPPENGETEALVSRLIANDPLIAPAKR